MNGLQEIEPEEGCQRKKESVKRINNKDTEGYPLWLDSLRTQCMISSLKRGVLNKNTEGYRFTYTLP